MDLTGSIEKKGNRVGARKRIRVAYLVSIDLALRSKDMPKAAALLNSGKPLYIGNADKMLQAMARVAKRYPKHEKAINVKAKKLANLAKSGR